MLHLNDMYFWSAGWLQTCRCVYLCCRRIMRYFRIPLSPSSWIVLLFLCFPFASRPRSPPPTQMQGPGLVCINVCVCVCVCLCVYLCWNCDEDSGWDFGYACENDSRWNWTLIEFGPRQSDVEWPPVTCITSWCPDAIFRKRKLSHPNGLAAHLHPNPKLDWKWHACMHAYKPFHLGTAAFASCK